MTKSMPREAHLGEEFASDLTITAMACAANVVVRDSVPGNAAYVRSEPAGTMEGGQLIWKLGDMTAGQVIKAKIWLKANKEGGITNCATVSADPRVCAATFVGKAVLTITKTGPQTAQLGADVTYNVVVKNTGNTVAHDVVVTDPVPEGMTGQPVTSRIGDLAPGASKSIPVTFKANKRGKICNTATVNSSNAGKADAEACTTIVQPGLKVVKTGTKEQFLTRNATYEIKVSNTGDTALTGVVVTDTAPAGTSVVSASAGGQVKGNTVTWNTGELKAGEEKTYSVVLTSRTAGNLCNNVTVATAQGLRETSQACTVWRGVSALLLEKADNPDPIQVGENTTYTVKVTNQGTADDTAVKVVVEFPAEIDPVSASNGGVVNGKTVTFPAYPRLAPKQAFEYSIVARGARAGDARVKFIRTSDGIPAPTTAEESTRVY